MGPAHLFALSGLLGGCATPSEPPADTGEPADTAVDTGDSADTADTADTGDTVDTGDTDTGPPPTDADGDGAWTPDDCDDADATVFPGAVDPCDDVDQDCDGGTRSPGSCGEPRGWEEVVRQVTQVSGSQTRVSPVGDTTGDGLGDFLVAADYVLPTSDGDVGYGYALYEGGARREELEVVPTGSVGCIVRPFSAVRPAGDLDGDGLGDYLEENMFSGGVGVIFSPLPTDGRCFDVWDGYDGFFSNWWFGEPGVGNWSVDGDLDGDGLPDFVSGEFGDPREYGYALAVADVFRGGEFGDPRSRITIPDAYYEGSGSSTPHIIEDIDGDGIHDLAVTEVWGQSTAWVISGPEAMDAGVSREVTDLAFLTLSAGSTDIIGSRGGMRTAGDWTGDGLADLLVEDAISTTLGYQHGELFVLDGNAHGDVDLDDAVGSWVGVAEESGLSWQSTGDFDGDGEMDLMLNVETGRTFVEHRMPSLRQPVSGLAFFGSAYIGDPPGDVDGDGRDDLPVALLDVGTAGLWYGWDIPFDDPSAW